MAKNLSSMNSTRVFGKASVRAPKNLSNMNSTRVFGRSKGASWGASSGHNGGYMKSGGQSHGGVSPHGWSGSVSVSPGR